MSNGNGSVAPTCPVNNGQLPRNPYGMPRGPSGRTVDVASIPPARDLLSVITALNMMNNIVQHITRGTPQINNTYGTSIIIRNSPPDQEDPPQYEPVRWKQITRDYHDDEVVNPKNTAQRIAIKTIKRNIWQEDATEQRVVYKGRQ